MGRVPRLLLLLFLSAEVSREGVAHSSISECILLAASPLLLLFVRMASAVIVRLWEIKSCLLPIFGHCHTWARGDGGGIPPCMWSNLM